jgi:septum formation protein
MVFKVLVEFLLKKLKDCYYNVVGLPLNKVKFMLREMGVNL